MKLKAGYQCGIKLMEKLVQITFFVSRADDGCCGKANKGWISAPEGE